jgi:hypothetical protein
MFILKIRHGNFNGKDELTNKEYQALPHNLRQYYKKVEDEEEYFADEFKDDYERFVQED